MNLRETLTNCDDRLVPVETNAPIGHSSATRAAERVAITIAVEASGIGSDGKEFVEQTHTEHVTRNGGSILLKQSLASEQVITLRCGRQSTESQARIVGVVGRTGEAQVYGVSLIKPDSSFWGIFFPPQDEIDAAFVRLPLQCAGCSHREIALLDEVEFTVFASSGMLSRQCRNCGRATAWQTIPNNYGPKQADKQLKPRAHGRTKLRKLACVCQPGWEDVVEAVDMSRGGLCFRSRREYPADAQVHVAVPYTPGSANIFVPGRIAWQRVGKSNLKLYGIDYARG